jgi:hypothetical protein
LYIVHMLKMELEKLEEQHGEKKYKKSTF